MIRELTDDNALKIFDYSLPVLILFRTHDDPLSQSIENLLHSTFDVLQNKILVVLANPHNSISEKFATLVGIEDTSTLPQLRIFDPNPGKTGVLKYTYPFNLEDMTRDELIQFIEAFQ